LKDLKEHTKGEPGADFRKIYRQFFIFKLFVVETTDPE
jgi:hypothetical protein